MFRTKYPIKNRRGILLQGLQLRIPTMTQFLIPPECSEAQEGKKKILSKKSPKQQEKKIITKNKQWLEDSTYNEVFGHPKLTAMKNWMNLEISFKHQPSVFNGNVLKYSVWL